MWTIACLVNTVFITNECRDDLFNEGQDLEGEIWNDLEDVTDQNGLLYFNPDHREHMDYIAGNDKVIKILKRYNAEGDICFGSLEDDNAGALWGYRFDGRGSMKKLKGTMTWEEKDDRFYGQPT